MGTFPAEESQKMSRIMLAAGLLTSLLLPAQAAELTPAERGRRALLTRTFNPPMWKLDAYEDAWRKWGLKQPPSDYPQAFMDHYGFHPAPYENGRYPMGLREANFLFKSGLTTDCMLCHGGSIAGKSYIGLGNASLDVQAVFEDLGSGTPFTFSNARGTSEAAGMAVYLMSHREPDLRLRIKALDLELHDDMCEDVPAWWLLKKKKTMYHTGGSDARSVRSLMQFMLMPTNSRTVFEKEESTFADIRAFLISLEAPKYPFPIDSSLAERGAVIFNETCSRCHGTYGDKWTYPNKIVPIDVIGTDRKRLEGVSMKFGEHYNRSWFGEEKNVAHQVTKPIGYQAPPLDGIWASAPYLHNGSVPTIYNVLNSKTRPKIFTRSFRTGLDDYDIAKVGWKVQILGKGPSPKLSAYERRKVYDTTQPGRSNGGHTFCDHLRDEQRRAVIEYLKTL
jgi:hypothetical protein